MPEDLFVIFRSGEIMTVGGVTALALDSGNIVYPGDNYENAYVEQSTVFGPNLSGTEDFLATNVKGDPTSAGQAKRNESWTCSMWKFTRGSNPIIYHPWFEVEAICDLRPDVASASASFYLPLQSGHVAVYSGLAASTTAINPVSNLQVYPGDYWRKEFVEQIGLSGSAYNTDFLATMQRGDAALGTALRPELFQASHYEITRTGLLTLWAPWISVRGGPVTAYPNT